MMLWNILGLANKHRTHEGAQSFECVFRGMENLADVHLKNAHNKTRKREDQVLIQILFEAMSKSLVFWPRKGGTPQKHFSAEISFLL